MRIIDVKHYIVQITDKALADMEDIYEYIALQLHAPDNTKGQYNRIAEAIERLNAFPERVRVMDSEPERTNGLKTTACRQFFSILCNQRGLILADGYWKIREQYENSVIGKCFCGDATATLFERLKSASGSKDWISRRLKP